MSEVIKSKMDKIATVVGANLPKTHGFCLLVMDFSENGRISYISNVERKQMRGAMKVFLDNWESSQK